MPTLLRDARADLIAGSRRAAAAFSRPALNHPAARKQAGLDWLVPPGDVPLLPVLADTGWSVCIAAA